MSDKLFSIFIEEGNEQSTELDKIMLSLEFLDDQIKQNQDKKQFEEVFTETIHKLFGIVHTIKASAGTLAFKNMEQSFHNLESYLSNFNSKTPEISTKFIDELINITSRVKDQINNVIQNRADINEPDYPDKGNENQLTEENKKPDTKNTNDSNSENKYFQIILSLSPDLLISGNDPISLFNELSDLGEIIENKVDEDRVPNLNNLKFDKLYFSWEIILKTKASLQEIDDIFIFVKASSNVIIEDISSRYTENGIDKLAGNKLIGEILVEKGDIKPQDVDESLKQQKPIGEILVEKGKVDKEKVEKAAYTQQQSRENQAATSIRVSTTKLDNLLNLVSELIIAQSRVNNLVENIKDNETKKRIQESTENTSILIKEIQESVMNSRMVSIEATFTQFYRVVRDLSIKQSKEIKLVLTGQDTEIDKNVIEKINSPLTHMIRNSIDHGIELPEEREAKGKNRQAIIHLKAYHKDGNVIIEINDDGKGLNKESILKKAIMNNIISENDQLSDDQIYNLIFNAGFSTAEEVTSVSGRGVGMDVVKRTVNNLRGHIEIKTIENKGTTFFIKLPLTMAIIDGLLVSIGNQLYVFPLLYINEVLKPTLKQVKTVENRGEIIEIRDKCYSLIRLHHIFNNTNSIKDPCEAILLCLEIEHKFFCFMVDEIISQSQIVLKNLEDNYTKVPGFSGATILGNGSVAMIIEPNDIINIYKRRVSYIDNDFFPGDNNEKRIEV